MGVGVGRGEGVSVGVGLSVGEGEASTEVARLRCVAVGEGLGVVVGLGINVGVAQALGSSPLSALPAAVGDAGGTVAQAVSAPRAGLASPTNPQANPRAPKINSQTLTFASRCSHLKSTLPSNRTPMYLC